MRRVGIVFEQSPFASLERWQNSVLGRFLVAELHPTAAILDRVCALKIDLAVGYSG